MGWPASAQPASAAIRHVHRAERRAAYFAALNDGKPRKAARRAAGISQRTSDRYEAEAGCAVGLGWPRLGG